MILGAEIGLLIVGLLALFRGKLSVGKGRELLGTRARILGAACLMPLPLSFILGLAFGIYLGLSGVDPSTIQTKYQWHFVGIEAAVVVGTVIVLSLMGSRWYAAQEAEADPQSQAAADYHHSYGPPPGVPDSYAAPGFDGEGSGGSGAPPQ